MATQHLESKQRKKAIRRGILGATALRVGFATIAVTLLGIIGLKLAGGLLLLYVVWKFYRELRTTPQQHEEKTSQKKSGFWQAIRLILVADVSMSLDNVLAVSAAAEENIIILAIGLLISIVLMGLASNRIAKKLQSYPQIQRIGLLVILFVALKMILHGAEEIQPLTAALNLAPLVVTITGLVFVVLHQRLIRPLDEQHILSRLQLHYLKIFLSLTITFILLIFFGHIIHDYLFTQIGRAHV